MLQCSGCKILRGIGALGNAILHHFRGKSLCLCHGISEEVQPLPINPKVISHDFLSLECGPTRQHMRMGQNREELPIRTTAFDSQMKSFLAEGKID